MEELEPLRLRWARTLLRRPARMALAALGLAAVGLGLALVRLEVSTERSVILGARHEYVRDFVALAEEFGDVDGIVVLVRARDRTGARACGAALAARLQADARVGSVFWQVPDEALRGHALLFTRQADLEEVERRLAEGGDALQAVLQGGLAGLCRHAAAAATQGGREVAGAEAARGFEFLASLVQGAAAAADGAPYAGAWWELAPPGVRGRDGHVWTRDGRLVLLVRPRAAAGPERQQAVAAVREAVAAASTFFPAADMGVTGGPVLEADEGAAFAHDARRATLLSAAFVAVVLVVALRRVREPALVLVALAWSMAATLGLAAAWPGHLNLITVVFCALLVGIGVDPGLHVLTRLDEALTAGLSEEDALVTALAGATPSAVASSAAVAVAFLAALFAEVDGVREFGWVAGAGVLCCLAGQLGLLPVLVALAARRGGRPRPTAGWSRWRPALLIDRCIERRPGWLAGGLLAGTALLAGWAALPVGGGPRLRFEPNLMLLQARGAESVRLASEVLSDEGLTGMFGAVVVEDEAALRRVQARVRRLPTVGRTESILDVVPADQPAKLAALRRIDARLEALLAAPPPPRPERSRAAEELAAALEPAARALLQGGRPGDADLVMRLQQRLETIAGAEPVAAARIDAWEVSFQADLGAALQRLREECRAGPLTAAALPPQVRGRFVGRSGRHLLRVYPKGDPWEPAALEAFLDDLRREVVDAGGFPVQLYESTQLLAKGARRVAAIAVAFVALVVLVHLRSAVVTALVLATAVVGASWAVGVMALLGVVVDPANVLGLPITLGLGVSILIHVAHRDREVREAPSIAGPPAVVASSAGRAVALAALTTAIGFAALGLSDHRGLASLGSATALGVGCCLLAALTLFPALLRLRAGPTPEPTLELRPGPRTGPGGRPSRPSDRLPGP